MRNELQMIPTNLEAPEGEVAAAQWRRSRKDEGKKTSLELDAAFATRRALGAWAAVEIVGDVDSSAPILRRPNSSFLHGFLEPRIPEGNPENICPPKVSSEGPCPPKRPPESNGPLKGPPEGPCTPKRPPEATCPPKAFPEGPCPPKRPPEGPCPPKRPPEGTCPLKSPPEDPCIPKRLPEDPCPPKRLPEDPCPPKRIPESPCPSKHPSEGTCFLKGPPEGLCLPKRPPESISAGHTKVPAEGSSEAPINGLPRKDPPPLEVNSERGKLLPVRKEEGEEEGGEDGLCPSRRLLSGPPSASKKPSFRVARRRDSRRKESRRCSKVASLASKFDAMVIESSKGKVQRTMSQKGVAAPRRRKAEGEVGRRGRKKAEEGRSERVVGTSVKDTIRMFEGNLHSKEQSANGGGEGVEGKGEEEKVEEEEKGGERGEGDEGKENKEEEEVIGEEEEVKELKEEEREEGEEKEEEREEREKELKEEEEDDEGGYEAVQTLAETAPAMRPNSSFLWGVRSYCERSVYGVRLPGYATVVEEDCYDDVGPPVTEKEERRVEGAYDVVPIPETLAEMASVSDCYESIYVGDGRVVEGGSRGGSGSDSLSGIEVKSNSLYGRCGSALSDDGGSCSSEGIAVHEVLSYQLTSISKGHELERRSETSDEWVDVDASTDDESTGATPLFCERTSRGRRSPKWSKKVRREWSSRSKKSLDNNEIRRNKRLPPPPPPRRKFLRKDFIYLRSICGDGIGKETQEVSTFLHEEGKEALEAENDQHHYETLYELVGEAAHVEQQESSAVGEQEPPVVVNLPQPRQHALPYENLSDDDDTDSFDSDVTAEFDDQVPTKELPSIPSEMPKSAQTYGDAPLPGVNTNGITKKMAKVAGKKMQELRKNWTMRKHDISRSIKQMSKRRASEVTVPGMTSHPQPPLPPTPDSEAPALPPPRTTSAPKQLPRCSMPVSLDPPPPPPLNKSVSSGSLTGRKYWSFKSRFGRRQSASTSSLQNCSPSSSPSSSTFYLTEAVNADTGLQENTDDNLKQGQSISPESRSVEGPYRWSVPVEDRKSKEERQKGGKPPVNRRLSVRPQGPPPPPPNTSQNGATKSLCVPYASPSSASSSSSSSSPYAFTSPTTSWYIDVELLHPGVLDHTNNGRVTDASDSSSSTVASLEGSVIHGQFTDEPLYQFYAASVAEKVTRDLSQDFDSDGYEEIKDLKSQQQQQRPKAMDLVHHKEGCRTLWCQIPEVLASGLLDRFNSHQRKIQEAKFEVITSEASYLKSLDILNAHFLESQVFKDENLLSKVDRDTLFSNVLPVKHCSEKFLADLERCWQEDILLLEICEIICHHAEKHFGVYVKYCSNQVHLDRALHRLKKSTQFLDALSMLEGHPMCQSLSLHSFLMLPMQRVTRLPLLVDAILRRMPSSDPHYELCQVALATLNKVVQECNEGARQAERLEEMKELCLRLDFREVGSPGLLGGGRWLVRKGELTHLYWRDDLTPHSNTSSSSAQPSVPSPSIATSKLTFGRRMTKQLLFLFLFSDLLVISKKRSEEHYVVLDYCPRNLVEVVAEGVKGTLQQLPPKYAGEGGRNIFLLSMLQNHDGKTVEMILSTPQESEKERWLQVFTPASSNNPDEQVYEEWDCPQVAAIHHYVAQQPDELSLEPSDVVNVLRKLSDGWYLGERIRDGEKGWFPANHCSQIMSSHVRAKNLRQRYRLLALSGDYLEQQRKTRALAKAAKKKKKLKKESKKD